MFNQSAPLPWQAGTDDTEAEQYGLQDPTIRLARQLSLDPLRLALFGDLHGLDSPAASNPQSAVNALKYALQHRPTVSLGKFLTLKRCVGAVEDASRR